MQQILIDRVSAEEKIAEGKWGDIDRTPGILLNATIEELGEVAHAINHSEGGEAIRQEVVETIGVLSRLYKMVIKI